jgi:thymidylate kinase
VTIAARPWLVDLIRRLEARESRYVALRVDDALLATGREIDLLVHPDALAGVLQEVASLTRHTPAMSVVHWREYPRHAATVLIVNSGAAGAVDSCRLDIRTAIHKRDLLLVDARTVLPDDTLWDTDLGIRRLTDDLETALLCLRNAVDLRTPSARHRGILEQRSSAGTFQAVRRLGFDPEALREGRVERVGRPSPISKVRYLTRALYGRALSRSSGLHVVLYGPDGVGKSTQGERLVDYLRGVGVRRDRVEAYHAFVPVERMPERSSSRTTAVKKDVYKMARTPILQVGLLTASYLKRLLALGRMRVPRRRKGIISVHDRYLFDVFLKFQKSHGQNHPRLERFLAHLSPSKDLVFVLRADPEVIAGRSRELSAAEIEAAYVTIDRCLAASRAEAVMVDANDSPDRITAVLIDHLTETQDRRFVAGHTS